MINIPVTEEQIQYARALVEKYNFGNRGVADGNPEEQFTGILGQTVVADVLGLPRPTGASGFDQGVDFVIEGCRVDVKTMGRTVPVREDFVHNFIALQKNYEVDGYLFCSYNKKKKILSICGLVSKQEFFQKAQFYPRGTPRYRSDGTSFQTKADLYEIGQKDLHPVYQVADIVRLLREIGEKHNG